MEMPRVPRPTPTRQNHLRANPAGNVFIANASFLIFSLLHLNISMSVGAQVSRFRYLHINVYSKCFFSSQLIASFEPMLEQ